MSDEAIYRSIVLVSQKLWPFRSIAHLAGYNEDMVTKDPNLDSPDDPGPVMVCQTCGTDNVQWDDAYCNECERFCVLEPREDYLKRHPEDRVE